MPTYLIRQTYTEEALRFMVENPTRQAGSLQPTEELQKMFAANGWTLLGHWLAVEDHEAGAVFVIDFPDRLDVARFALISHARGHSKAFQATPLLSMAEFRQVLGAAAGTPVDHRADDVPRVGSGV